jgi:hypothetical protein
MGRRGYPCPVRDATTVTAERMLDRLFWDQGIDSCKDSIKHFWFECAQRGKTFTRRRVASHPTSQLGHFGGGWSLFSAYSRGP